MLNEQSVRRTVRATAATVLVLAAGPLFGDVRMEERIRVEGDGLMKMLNMTGNIVTTIAGDRARTESRIEMESRLMRAFGGSADTIEIVRLDQEKVYQLDPKKRTYSEITFAEQRAEMERAMAQMREAQQSQQQGASGIDESQCEWSEPTTVRERSGETEEIAGHRAERNTVRATQSCTDRTTGQVCDFELTLDQWLAPGYETAREVLDYYVAYAGKMGLDTPGSRDFAERAESMFGGYGGIWEALAGSLREAEAYPLRTRLSLAIGGPQCQNMRDARAAGEAARPGVGEVIGGALGGQLGGLLGRKRDSAKAAESAPATQEPAATAGGDMLRLMAISAELVGVSQQAAEPGAFEVPADYKPAR